MNAKRVSVMLQVGFVAGLILIACAMANIFTVTGSAESASRIFLTEHWPKVAIVAAMGVAPLLFRNRI